MNPSIHLMLPNWDRVTGQQPKQRETDSLSSPGTFFKKNAPVSSATPKPLVAYIYILNVDTECLQQGDQLYQNDGKRKV